MEVTYRYLSRELGLHVNVAKNYLASFHASTSSSGSAHATYLVTGQMQSPAEKHMNNAVNGESDMDVDMENTPKREQEDSEVVPCTKILLVAEGDLPGVRGQFARIFSEHIYSLSPAPLTDAGLICDPLPVVWEKDNAKSKDASVLLGRITGLHSGKPNAAVASSSRLPAVKPKEPTMKRAPAPASKEEENPAKLKIDAEPKAKEAPKPKPSGKLDWSKAKPKLKETPKPAEEDKGADVKAKAADSKAAKAEEAKRTKANAPQIKKEPSPDTSSADASEKPIVRKGEPKRGTKRKSVLPAFSDSEDETPPKQDPVAKITTRVKKNVVLSDDDEEDEMPVRSRSKRAPTAKANGKVKVPSSDSEADRSVRAMMDIDDDEVVRASRPEPKASEEPEDAPMEDADAVHDSEPERVKAKPKKRKEKKVIPVGRNGLKKKRVMKSRTKIDDKGYMVTEDYSSYESVDEETEEAGAPEAPAKKGRAAKPKQPAAEPKLKVKEPREEARTKTSEAGKRATGTKAQGNIMNFFGKK
ncbi:hypothetical protein CERSUDRAFT_91421 [Gelatoporia subvermispora B]|uniref:DNA polymerase delta subunit 3 n=1 Tax=Ceriporiopsis subvermispora (strain B) TaxID=914234 RepID=M2QUD9_CERS8|nr:hypothetical protein CERSUDRAFT_91421 [Gelatoporia subvermispora B]